MNKSTNPEDTNELTSSDGPAAAERGKRAIEADEKINDIPKQESERDAEKWSNEG